MPQQFYNWKSRQQQEPGKSLPLLPGIKNQADFAKKFGLSKNIPRQYRDARAQYAGHESYAAWIKAREQTGTKRKPKPPLPPGIPVRHGAAHVWEWEKPTKIGRVIAQSKSVKNASNLLGIDLAIRSLPGDTVFQIAIKGQFYADTPDPNMWGFVSTIPFEADDFRKKFYNPSGQSIHTYMVQFHQLRGYTFPDERDIFPAGYSWRMHGKSIIGVLEFHLVVWEKPGQK